MLPLVRKPPTVVGGLIGVMVDIVVAEGIFVAIVGHAGAAAGAVIAVRRARPRARPGEEATPVRRYAEPPPPG